MTNKDAILAKAVADHAVPFVVAMTANAGGVTYRGAAGEAAKGLSAADDTVFRIFSMTKAVGSTAAMMLIDRGKLSMDTPVEEILPEFKDIQVLDGFDGETPRLRAPKRKATVRHLATHTSGLEYDLWNGDVSRALKGLGKPPIFAGTKAALLYPMMSDPGTRWGYGIGIDWLGQVVEAVDGRRIDRFCADELFGPLGMVDTSFEVSPAQAKRLAEPAIRKGDGRFAPHRSAPPANPEVYGMGHALYSTPRDYLTFLRLFLNKGTLNGHRLLSEQGLSAMLADQMGGLSFQPMVTAVPAATADFNPFPGVRKTHSFGFMRNEEDIPGMRSAGSLAWAGILNTHYWIDPKKDVAAVLMTQTMPFVEPPFMALYEAFERAVYAA
jgi:CubicO group peptidase (beta-lactamase class C family)